MAAELTDESQTKRSNGRGRAQASRQRNEEEQVNKREATQPPEHTKIPPKPAIIGWLLTRTAASFAAKRAYQTAIFDKRMPCITAQTIDRQLVSVVKVSI